MNHRAESVKFLRPLPILLPASLLLVSSCATGSDASRKPAADLPPDVAMNFEAGRGMILFVQLHTEDGREFPFALDTGSPATSVPKSLGPALGKTLGKGSFATMDDDKGPTEIHAAPPLYLGHTRLVTGSRVASWDRPIGVLGMDCLQHYCIQLDFEAGQLRFLDARQLDATELGTPFRLVNSRYTKIRHAAFFASKEVSLLIDTGFPFDASVNAGDFERESSAQQASSLPFVKDGEPRGNAPGIASFPRASWHGQSYTNLIVQNGPNLIGLRFLGRHLVTFNFPEAMMYLKQTRVGPLER